MKKKPTKSSQSIGMLPAKDAISGVRENTRFITGIKGIAIALVISFHIQFLYSDVPDFIHKFTIFNGTWLTTFFVVSAYTISIGIPPGTKVNLVRYMKRRFWRIAPTYFVMLLLAFIAWPLMTNKFDSVSHVPDLMRRFLFLNTSPFDQKNQIVILGVEWFIPVLFWLYVCIPLILMVGVRLVYVYPFVLFLTLVIHFNRGVLGIRYDSGTSFFWSVQNFMWVYVVALCAERLRRWSVGIPTISVKSVSVGLLTVLPLGYLLKHLGTQSERVFVVLMLSCGLYVLFFKRKLIFVVQSRFPSALGIVENLDVLFLLGLLFKYILNFYFIKNPIEFLTLWSVDLIFVGYFRPYLVRLLLENSIVQWLGRISYGLYLTHFLVMTAVGYIIPSQTPFIRTLVIVPVSIGIAYLLNRFVENPVAARMNPKSTP